VLPIGVGCHPALGEKPTALSVERGAGELIWCSMNNQAIKRRHPGFNERAHGFRSLNDLLLESQKHVMLKLRLTRNLVATRCGPWMPRRRAKNRGIHAAECTDWRGAFNPKSEAGIE